MTPARRALRLSRVSVSMLTMLFSDIEGSTKLLEHLGDGYAGALTAHHRIVRAALAAHGGSQRVVELAERFGEHEGGRIEIALPLSQEELAAWAGASREAVSKTLQVLRSLRIVETGRRHITVLDVDALRRRAAV